MFPIQNQNKHDFQIGIKCWSFCKVEAIVGHKSKRGASFFLVRWKGYGKDDDSWEPEAELNCDDLIAEYRKKVRDRVHFTIYAEIFNFLFKQFPLELAEEKSCSQEVCDSYQRRARAR